MSNPARRVKPVAASASVVVAIFALGLIATVTTQQGEDARQPARQATQTQQTHTTKAAPPLSSPRPSRTPELTRPSRTYSASQLASLREGALVHTVIEPFGIVTVYKIKPGDTLWDIARTFAVAGVDKTLYEWNRSVIGQDPNLIHPGALVIVDPTGKVTTDKIRPADSGQPR